MNEKKIDQSESDKEVSVSVDYDLDKFDAEAD